MERLNGAFTLLAIDAAAPAIAEVDGIPVATVALSTDRDDPTGALRERYLGEADGALYLIRPDQHVAARWAEANADDIRRAIRIATAQEARA